MTFREAVTIAYREIGEPEDKIQDRFRHADLAMATQYNGVVELGQEREFIDALKRQIFRIRSLSEEDKAIVKIYIDSKQANIASTN